MSEMRTSTVTQYNSKTKFLPQLIPLGCLGESGATVASLAEMGTGIGVEDAQVAGTMYNPLLVGNFAMRRHFDHVLNF